MFTDVILYKTTPYSYLIAALIVIISISLFYVIFKKSMKNKMIVFIISIILGSVSGLCLQQLFIPQAKIFYKNENAVNTIHAIQDKYNITYADSINKVLEENNGQGFFVIKDNKKELCTLQFLNKTEVNFSQDKVKIKMICNDITQPKTLNLPK